MTMSVWYKDYAEIAKALNACGLKRLREYCTTKKRPVRNFDRDIEIVKYALRFGTNSGVIKYSLSKQRIDQIMRKYWEYAKAAMGEETA